MSELKLFKRLALSKYFIKKKNRLFCKKSIIDIFGIYLTLLSKTGLQKTEAATGVRL